MICSNQVFWPVNMMPQLPKTGPFFCHCILFMLAVSLMLLSPTARHHSLQWQLPFLNVTEERQSYA